MTSRRSSREVVEAFVGAVNNQDWAALEQLVAADFTRHAAESGPPAATGRDALLDFLRQEYRSFPDAKETIEDILCDGDKVAVRHRFTGTQTGPLGEFPGKGMRATSDYIAIYRIEGDMIAEAWVAWDNLSVLRQLGHG